MTGELGLLAGDLVVGPETQVALFDQHRTALDDDLTLQRTVAPDGGDTVYPGADGGRPTHVAAWLARFAFHARQLNMPVRSLSGGERNRLALARFLLTSANVLLLDEPTNDLDLTTLAILEEALLGFNGTAVVVSHDRYFLDRVATRLVAFEDWPAASPGQTRREVFLQPGGWSTYRRLRAPALDDAWAEEARRARDADRERRAGGAATKPTAPAQSGLSAKERKELVKLEADIAAGETQSEALEAQLADPAVWRGDGAAGRALTVEKATLANRLEGLMARWAALAARDV
jgi:ATP-binding cassette subfamily F protein uup